MKEPTAIDEPSSGFLRRLAERDPEAWVTLVRHYSPLIYAQCRRGELDGEATRDVVQSVFASVLRKIRDFEPRNPGSFRAWLRTITRNCIHDHYRKIADRPVAPGGDDHYDALERVPDPNADETQFASTSPRISRLHHALEGVRCRFSPRTWDAFWYLAVEDRNTDDVASDLGMSSGAVRQAKYKVLRRLRDELRNLNL